MNIVLFLDLLVWSYDDLWVFSAEVSSISNLDCSCLCYKEKKLLPIKFEGVENILLLPKKVVFFLPLDHKLKNVYNISLKGKRWNSIT
jgi:hypothetical protein